MIGTGGADQLTFRESSAPGTNNGFGPFLDDVRMIEL